jgi:hypothetical protein
MAPILNTALQIIVPVLVIIGVFIAIGRKLQILDTINKNTEELGCSIDKLKESHNQLNERFVVVEDRVETIWKDKFAPAGSPRQLNTLGEKILNESGIKQIIENNKDRLFKIIKEKEPTNAYDAERLILSVVNELPKHCPEIIDELKQSAFKAGQDIDAILLVGGIYLRNLIFDDLGFSLIDLDKKNKKEKN